MEFRIKEKQFENKTEFYPEWWCGVKGACNYGWNSVHDENLMTIPSTTHEDALKRIEWFSKCFKKPINIVMYNMD